MQLATTAPKTRITLASVKTGRIAKPPKILGYGPEGVGKTTFAGDAPKPCFICSEDGTNEFENLARFAVNSWEQVDESLDVLENENHDYQTVALDTLDWLDWLCERFICNKSSKETLQDFGYGKGYDMQCDEWRRFLVRLDRLRDKRGMAIVALAHSHVKVFQNPEGDDYDRYQMKLQKKLSEATREWADCVLFMNFETLTHKEDPKAKKAKGVRGRSRIMHTERSAAFDAKNRYGLPAKLPLSWLEFDIARGARQPDSPEKIREQVAELLDEADEKTKADTAASLERCGDDAIKLSKLCDWLRGKIEIAKE